MRAHDSVLDIVSLPSDRPLISAIMADSTCSRGMWGARWLADRENHRLFSGAWISDCVRQSLLAQQSRPVTN